MYDRENFTKPYIVYVEVPVKREQEQQYGAMLPLVRFGLLLLIAIVLILVRIEVIFSRL